MQCLTLEDGTGKLSRNVGSYYQSTPRNIPENPRSQVKIDSNLLSTEHNSTICGHLAASSFRKKIATVEDLTILDHNDFQEIPM